MSELSKLIEDILAAISEVCEKSDEVDFEGVLTNYALVVEFVTKDGTAGQQLFYSHPHPMQAFGLLEWNAQGLRVMVQQHKVHPNVAIVVPGGHAEPDDDDH